VAVSNSIQGVTPMQDTKPAAAPECVMVIFGAAGDLANRLLIPALFNLAKAGLLNDGFKVLGVDHNERDDARFRHDITAFLESLITEKDSGSEVRKLDREVMQWLSDRLFYQVGDFQDAASFQTLAARLMDFTGKEPNALFYLAVSPRFFGDIIENLAGAKLVDAQSEAFRRVVIEKPFGEDLASAQALNAWILKYLQERQIYRIDHFLGKETVRNIMVTRFANGVFEPLWNRLHIDHVQITATETLGVEDRGAFYDKTGALRDMVPNHLFQILAMVAMEPPNSFAPEAVRTEKSRVFEAIEVQSQEQALNNSVRGQYRGGTVEGRPVKDYRAEQNVSPASTEETYVALKFTIDNWRWAGVPFYVRTGKALRKRTTEVAVRFKPAPALLFQESGQRIPACNTLVIRIQPDEGISLQFEAKEPGPADNLHQVAMDFRYVDYFGQMASTGYETLIYDCMVGDQTLFKRADDIENAWRAVQPFLDAWKEGGEVSDYAAGSDGPVEADDLMARDGRSWRPLE
jgi:glucose-6-phosphate 1-dehydrogenase